MARTLSNWISATAVDEPCAAVEAFIINAIRGAPVDDIQKTVTDIHRRLTQDYGGPVAYDIVRKVVTEILYGKQAELISSMVDSLPPAKLAEIIQLETARHDTRRSAKPVIISKNNGPLRK